MYYRVLGVILIGFFDYCVSGECLLPRNWNTEYLVAQNFGFQKIILRNGISKIKLEDGEIVDAYCENGFRGCGEDLGRKIEIHCLEGQLEIRKSGEHQFEKLGCDLTCAQSDVLQIYESKRKLANWEPHTSLALGIRVSPAISKVYAGICYDWKRLDLKYINYMAYKDQNMIIPGSDTSNRTDSGKFQAVTMDKLLPNFETYFKFMSKIYFMDNYAVLQRNHSLLELFNFDYEILVQDRSMAKIFEPHADFLNIIWWRNLRLGNWRTFLNLLEERSTAVKYDITTGTGGVVVMPNVASTCKTNVTLEIPTEDNAKKIAAPAYIWTYLKAVSANVTEDFVVIGYNSPFYKKHDSFIFCQDICDEIHWLRRFAQIRLIPTMGLVFCCRPKEVAHKLDNFPLLAEDTADRRDDLAWKIDDVWRTTSSTPEPEYLE